MMSSAPDVETYIAKAPEARRETLTRLRDLCRDTMPVAEERIAYGMPSYWRGGTLLVAFASQKNHLSIYGCHGAAERQGAALAGVDRGKGCFRFRQPDAIDFAVWRTILEDVATHASAVSS